jgi:small-conductance mechanosensitive channel
LYQSESILKVYKNDLEFLKSELNSQNEITERLSETLNQTRDELEEVRKQNMQLKQQLDDTNKKFDENVNKKN